MKIRAWSQKAAAHFAALGNFFRRQWKKIATVIAGHGLYSVLSWIYDNLLYIPVIAYFGPLWGGIGLTFGSLLICFCLLFHYRRKQVDWLGYDVLDDLKAQGIKYAERLKGWRLKDILISLPSIMFLDLPLFFSVLALWLADKIIWLWLDTEKIGALQTQCIRNLRARKAKQALIAAVFYVPAILFRFCMWCLKVGGDVIAFFVLCIFEDPFITTAYLRHGSHDGLRKKDLVIFFASVLVSNGYWIARTYALLEIARTAFRKFFN